MSFHQTTPLDPQTLREAIVQAKRQEDAIAAIFARFPHLSLAPSQVHELVRKAGKPWPVTSCRRAITDLEHAGTLTKTRSLHVGPHGRFEYRWQLASPVEQTMLPMSVISGAPAVKVTPSQTQQNGENHGHFESGGMFGTGYCRA